MLIQVESLTAAGLDFLLIIFDFPSSAETRVVSLEKPPADRVRLIHAHGQEHLLDLL